jgi:hypothetical protein
VERSVPIELNVIEEEAAVATNEYHTSSSGVPVAQPTGTLPLVVANHTEPVVPVPIVKLVAVPQLSFVGAGW